MALTTAPTDPQRGPLRVRTADLSRARPPKWAWESRVLLGYLNLLLGNEGAGKSTLAAWLLGQLTRGSLPGDLHGKPVYVAVLGDDDLTRRYDTAGVPVPDWLILGPLAALGAYGVLAIYRVV